MCDIGPDGGVVLSAGDTNQIVVITAHGPCQIGSHLIDLTLHLAAGDLGEGRMFPTVICQLMTFGHHAGQQRIVVFDTITAIDAAHEECGGNTSRSQSVQQRGSVVAGTVIKGDGNELVSCGLGRNRQSADKGQNQCQAQQQGKDLLFHFYKLLMLV